jgi:hypothetical protein
MQRERLLRRHAADIRHTTFHAHDPDVAPIEKEELDRVIHGPVEMSLESEQPATAPALKIAAGGDDDGWAHAVRRRPPFEART